MRRTVALGALIGVVLMMSSCGGGSTTTVNTTGGTFLSTTISTTSTQAVAGTPCTGTVRFTNGYQQVSVIRAQGVSCGVALTTISAAHRILANCDEGERCAVGDFSCTQGSAGGGGLAVTCTSPKGTVRWAWKAGVGVDAPSPGARASAAAGSADCPDMSGIPGYWEKAIAIRVSGTTDCQSAAGLIRQANGGPCKTPPGGNPPCRVAGFSCRATAALTQLVAIQCEQGNARVRWSFSIVG
jgi:hypothetical protein